MLFKKYFQWQLYIPCYWHINNLVNLSIPLMLDIISANKPGINMLISKSLGASFNIFLELIPRSGMGWLKWFLVILLIFLTTCASFTPSAVVFFSSSTIYGDWQLEKQFPCHSLGEFSQQPCRRHVEKQGPEGEQTCPRPYSQLGAWGGSITGQLLSGFLQKTSRCEFRRH